MQENKYCLNQCCIYQLYIIHILYVTNDIFKLRKMCITFMFSIYVHDWCCQMVSNTTIKGPTDAVR